MQEVPGVDCYCCGHAFGTNSQCGKNFSKLSTLKKRPPCLWAHTDPTIVAACLRKMKLKKDSDSLAKQLGMSSCMKEVLPDIPVLPIDTQVYIPSLFGKGGLRGVVYSWNEGTHMYGITWPVTKQGNKMGLVPQKNVFKFIDFIGSFPDGALAFDASVRCGDEHIPGIIQGVAVNHLNVPIAYDVGPNSSGSNFFAADVVSLVQLEHGLSEDFGTRMAQVGQFIMDVLEARDEVIQIESDSDKVPSTTTSSFIVGVGNAVKSATATSPKVATSSGGKAGATAPKAPTPPPPPKVATSSGGKVPLAKAATPPPRKIPPPPSPGDAPGAKGTQKGIDVSPQSHVSVPAVIEQEQDSSASGSSSSGSDSSSDSSGSGSEDSHPDADADAERKKPTGKAGNTPVAAKAAARSPTGVESRKRATKFNYLHDAAETVTIFMQLSSNVPWLHTRKGQKAIWMYHLKELQAHGHAMELVGHKDAGKTFAAWAAHICKTRRMVRLAEAKKSGVAEIGNDAVDDVAHRWEIKVCGEAALSSNNQERAAMMRDLATSTGVQLAVKAQQIDESRKRRFNAKGEASTPSKSHKSSTSPTSPADIKTNLLRQLTNLTQVSAEQEALDNAMINAIVERVAAVQQTPAASNLPSAGDVLLLESLLREEDSSLVSWAPKIYEALGISASEHFEELSAADIMAAAGIPMLQKVRLVALGKRFGLK